MWYLVFHMRAGRREECSMRYMGVFETRKDTIYAIDDGYRRWCQATACIDGLSMAWVD